MRHRMISESGRTEPGFDTLRGDRFQFACHPGVACFTVCCADLYLLLTPYDILRIKRRLNISADRFLERYTDPVANHTSMFPMVKLRMSEAAGRPCPFLNSRGCTIYEDRPGACRLYPIGRAATARSMGVGERASHFVVREPHCLGFQEGREWTVEQWIADQGAAHYNEMNRAWVEIITADSPMRKALTKQKLEMFFLASYNLDRFRDFVVGTRFLRLFQLEKEETEKIKTDDEALLSLGMRWLQFALFGRQTLSLRKPSSIAVSAIPR